MQIREYKAGQKLYPPTPFKQAGPDIMYQADRPSHFARAAFIGYDVTVIVQGTEVTCVFKDRGCGTRIEYPELSRLAPDNGKVHVFAGTVIDSKKRDQYSKCFRSEIVLWDLLVWNGKHLIGASAGERRSLLENTFFLQYPMVVNPGGQFSWSDHILHTDIPGINVAKFIPGGYFYFREYMEEIKEGGPYYGMVITDGSEPLQAGDAYINNQFGRWILPIQ